LNQALYVLRTALGEDAVLSRGDGDVALNGGAVWCDVTAFEEALDNGRHGDALALYRGDLLEGFFVTGAPEFERWIDRERARLRERASQGAWTLAEERAAAGDAVEAGRWARRAAELAPADEAVARRLMTFLTGLGDRAAAIRAYEEFASTLAGQYELEPSASTRALADAIRKPDAWSAGAIVMDAALPREGPHPPVPRTVVGRRRVAAALALLVGCLLGGWFVLRPLINSSSTPRIVVLPFTNLGPAEDEYFADGITEEIAARLAAIERLRVIGRTSTNRYKGTEKTIPEIGRELGVDYVLEGSVRWEKSPGGAARVRVTPQLVSTKDGMHLWARVYDEPLDELFRVQSDIARKVVQALDVTLLERERHAVEAVPTHNIQAYDYYLRGIEYWRRGREDRLFRAATRMFERAVELDSNFALAHAMLSLAHTRMYQQYFDRSQTRLASAKSAVDKAFALQPDLPEAHQSLGMYYWARASENDYDRALRELAITEASRPYDPRFFAARAVLRGRRGRYPEALVDIARALDLDPASAAMTSTHGELWDLTRDFARAERLYDRAIALSPDWAGPYVLKAGLYLRRNGATAQARAVLDEADNLGLAESPEIVFNRILIAIYERKYNEAITRLSGAPDVFADQLRFAPRAQLYAEVYGLMQRPHVARAYSDSARAIVVARLGQQPEDPRLHSALGIAYAGLGRMQEAIQEGRRAAELRPISEDTYQGYPREWDLARIYVMAGEYEAALDRLEHLLSIPGYLTSAWLRIDPTWDPLRAHPRFQTLVGRR
jgi:serine/threonine-protein kinase